MTQRICQVLLSAALLSVLAGCYQPTTMPTAVWDKAYSLCNGLGGVKAITNRGFNFDRTGVHVTAYCKSGAEVDAVITREEVK